MRAVWNGETIAESEKTIEVENQPYFPPDSVKREFFSESPTTTTCPWKGIATYYNVDVNGEINRDAAFSYQSPKEAATHMKGFVAFWCGVQIVE